MSSSRVGTKRFALGVPFLLLMQSVCVLSQVSTHERIRCPPFLVGFVVFPSRSIVGSGWRSSSGKRKNVLVGKSMSSSSLCAALDDPFAGDT